MGVVSLYSFRPLPGKLFELMSASEEARQLLGGLGMQAMTLTTIAGSEEPTIATVVGFDDNADWARANGVIQSDPGWQAFYSRVMAQPIAEQVENSLFADVDPTYSPAIDRPLGALAATQWRPKPGRFNDFLGHVLTACGHIERLGGTPRVMQCLMGKNPLTVIVSVTFEDLLHMGEYNDKTAVDEQWNSFWLGVMADPAADLVRSQVASITVG